MKKTAAIVLGGGLKLVTDKKTGLKIYEPGTHVKKRLDKAFNLFKHKEADFIITTGNFSNRVEKEKQINGPSTEAECGKEYMLLKYSGKISGNDILTETDSVDTIGNAWFAKKQCLEPNKTDTCYIITADYHMERSKVIFSWVLGPGYKIYAEEISTDFKGKEERIRLENIFIDFTLNHLVKKIKAGDDKAIEHFMKYEHISYCLSERSFAMFQACMKTASVKAGY